MVDAQITPTYTTGVPTHTLRREADAFFDPARIGSDQDQEEEGDVVDDAEAEVEEEDCVEVVEEDFADEVLT